MRKPFLFFIVLISIYCWLTDVIELFFYFSHTEPAHKHVIGHLVSAALLMGGWLILAFSLYKKYGYTAWLKDIFQPNRKKEWLLLLLASTPVLLLGLFRSILPDQNFDTYHFELYLQDYDFTENKINFAAGALRTYYFPLPERVYALFRHLLGYRLGTLFNTFLLVTILVSAYDFVMNFLSLYENGRKHKVIVLVLLSLFILLADNTLFIIGSYKPDLIGIPLLLELANIALLDDSNTQKTRRYFYFFLLASLTITYKLTFLPYVGIFCLIYFFRHFKNYPVIQRFSVPVVILLFPAIYMAYNFVETGNPLFPFFNTIFHAPLYPFVNFKDERWGHKKPYEIFIFHVVTFFDKTRTNEWEMYSYRLLFGYFISLGTIVFYLLQRRKYKFDKYLQQLFFLSLLAVLFDYCCLITTGYYRYGVIVEVMYGLVITLLILRIPRKGIAALFLIPVLIQLYSTIDNIYIRNINLSWHTYQSLEYSEFRKPNMAKMFSDYGSITDNNHIIPQIDAFVSTDPYPYDGLAKQLNKKIPIYDLFNYGRTTDSIKTFDKNVVRPLSQTKNLMVVAPKESIYGGTFQILNNRGYLVTNIYEVYPDFMQPGEPLFLLKIKYLDTTAFTIKSTLTDLREENQKDFSYTSKNKVKTFIREAPYAFNWLSQPTSLNLTINSTKYSTTDRFTGKKIFTVDADSLTVHKSVNTPYLIITQEVENKK